MILRIYRIIHGKKISGFRLLGYTFFGYAIGGVFDTIPLAINTLIVGVGIMGASILNDYYDWKLGGEINDVGSAVQEGRLSERNLLVLFLLPFIVLSMLIASLWWVSITKGAFILILVNLFLSVAYSIPKLRFKERPIIGILAPPIGIFFLFFEGLILLGYPNKTQLMVASIVFLFAWFLEFLHLVDDAEEPNEVHKITGQTGMQALRIVVTLGIVTGAIFSYYSVLFLITLIAWLLRAYTLSNMHACEILAARRSVFHPLWRLEEFVVYALFLIFI
ncbi:MAG: UbiA family prenyltransferase [bacterium]|nr:UbiA family prenyltransferase [bacterium]